MEQKLLDLLMHQYKKSFSDNTKGKKLYLRKSQKVSWFESQADRKVHWKVK
jgi:hypothetical protein